VVTTCLFPLPALVFPWIGAVDRPVSRILFRLTRRSDQRVTVRAWQRKIKEKNPRGCVSRPFSVVFLQSWQAPNHFSDRWVMPIRLFDLDCICPRHLELHLQIAVHRGPLAAVSISLGEGLSTRSPSMQQQQERAPLLTTETAEQPQKRRGWDARWSRSNRPNRPNWLPQLLVDFLPVSAPPRPSGGKLQSLLRVATPREVGSARVRIQWTRYGVAGLRYGPDLGPERDLVATSRPRRCLFLPLWAFFSLSRSRPFRISSGGRHGGESCGFSALPTLRIRRNIDNPHTPSLDPPFDAM